MITVETIGATAEQGVCILPNRNWLLFSGGVVDERIVHKILAHLWRANFLYPKLK